MSASTCRYSCTPDELEAIADNFATLPMYFLRFFGSTGVDKVLDAMEYAVYVHDVEHIVLDNLQFMMGTSSGKVCLIVSPCGCCYILKLLDECRATRNSMHRSVPSNCFGSLHPSTTCTCPSSSTHGQALLPPRTHAIHLTMIRCLP